LERREDLNRNFAIIIDFALNNKPDLFLVSGDVFDKILPTNASRVFLTQKMRLLKEADIPVFIIGGNHDVPKVGRYPHLAIEVLHSAGLATVFTRSDTIQKQILKIDNKTVCISGKSYYTHFERANPLKGINIPLNGDYNILMIHASLQGLNVTTSVQEMVSQNPFKVDDVERGLNYLALGHFHNHFEREYQGCNIVNPGSIEKLSWAEMNDDKGFVFVEINGSETSTEFIKLPTRPMERCELVLSKDREYSPNVKDFVVKYISNMADKDKMIRFDIKGMITQDQYSQFKLNEIYETTRNILFHLYVDRRKLEVEGYGRIFLERIDNPVDAFTKRLDTLIASAETDDRKQLLEEVKQLGINYLEAAI